jgi:hypothetical protein
VTPGGGRRKKPRSEPFPCPACGETVPAGRPSCPACGADDATGWQDDDPVTTEQDLGAETHLDDERYEEFLREEFEDETIETSPPSRFGFLLVVLGILVVASLLALLTTAKSQ